MKRTSRFRGEWLGRLAAVLLVLAGAAPLMGGAAGPGQEIVGGSPVKAGEMPFMAAIWFAPASENGPWCDGTLIAPDKVLTAGSCMFYSMSDGVTSSIEEMTLDVLQVSVQGRSGAPLSELKRIAVTSVEYKPGFDITTCSQPQYGILNPCADDAAVLHLASPAKGAAPVPLIASGDDAYSREGRSLTVAGWSGEFLGQPPTGQLTQARMPVFRQSLCERRYERMGRRYDFSPPIRFDRGGSFCLYRQETGACFEEWGGPALVRDGQRWLQAGILSNVQGCAEAKWPNVYTGLAVPEMNQWVRSAAGLPAGKTAKGGR